MRCKKYRLTVASYTNANQFNVCKSIHYKYNISPNSGLLQGFGQQTCRPCETEKFRRETGRGFTAAGLEVRKRKLTRCEGGRQRTVRWCSKMSSNIGGQQVSKRHRLKKSSKSWCWYLHIWNVLKKKMVINTFSNLMAMLVTQQVIFLGLIYSMTNKIKCSLSNNLKCVTINFYNKLFFIGIWTWSDIFPTTD